MFIEQLNFNKELLKEKDEKIENLLKENEKLKREGKSSKNDGIPINPITVHFISVVQRINSAYICGEDDPFVKVEEQLYIDYPEYIEKNNYFLSNGDKVKRFKTIKEKKTNKRGIKITLYSPDE